MLGIAAQVVFVASWLVAASWQGKRYSVLKQSVSDLYARTAPHGIFLVIVLTICGAVTIGFALFSVRPALRLGGRAATVGSVLLALSVAGLGDLMSPFERLACRAADPGCTTSMAVSNSGGKLDGNLTAIGVVLLVLAAFFLAHAMQRIPGWRAWARPTRLTAVLIIGLTVAEALTKANTGGYGLFERLIAATAAVAIAALGIGILRRSRDAGGSEPGSTNQLDRVSTGGSPKMSVWKRMTSPRWKVVALVTALVAVLLIVLLLLGDTLGVNHQGHTSLPSPPAVTANTLH